jgi:hypothetical protein
MAMARSDGLLPKPCRRKCGGRLWNFREGHFCDFLKPLKKKKKF